MVHMILFSALCCSVLVLKMLGKELSYFDKGMWSVPLFGAFMFLFLPQWPTFVSISLKLLFSFFLFFIVCNYFSGAILCIFTHTEDDKRCSFVTER